MLAAACAIAGSCAAAAPGSARRLPNWAAPQISTVVAHGLMARNVRNFRPNAILTQQTLANLTSGLQEQLGDPPVAPPPASDTGTTGTTTTGTTTGTVGSTTTPTGGTTTTPSGNPSSPITMAQLDRNLVVALGLKKAAKEFTQGAHDAGISVPGRFGTEVVARLLGLRTNHPAAQDFIELRPQDPATRAEAAYSAAQILGFGLLADSWQVAQVKSLADAFTLPTVGNNWFIQSSGEGVALAQLSDWYVKKYAWGRRPLHEAGLD